MRVAASGPRSSDNAGLRVSPADRIAAEPRRDPAAVEIDVIIAPARHRPAVDPDHSPAGSLERGLGSGLRRDDLEIAARIDLDERRRRRAATAVQAAVDPHFDRVGIGAVAHPVAACQAGDGHIQARRGVASSRRAGLERRRRLDDLHVTPAIGEHHVGADRQVPERLGAHRAIIAVVDRRRGVGRGRRVICGRLRIIGFVGISLACGESRGEGHEAKDHSHTVTNPRAAAAVPLQIARLRSSDPASLTSRMRVPSIRSTRMLLERIAPPCRSWVIAGSPHAISVA